MKSIPRAFRRAENAQGMVEFALIFPLLLLLVFGVIEFGRLLAIYSMMTTASREAARYGAAAGDVGDFTPHYLDCDGIREAAKKQGVLVGIQDNDITISYDHGPNTSPYATTCPPTEEVKLGDRLMVSVTAYFQPMIGFLNIPAFPVNSTTARTILKDIEIKGTPPAAYPTNTPTPTPTTETSVPPTPTPTPTQTPTPTHTNTPLPTLTPTGPTPTPPIVYFTSSGQSASEDIGTMTVVARLTAATYQDVTVPFTVSGTATQGRDYAITTSPVIIPAGSLTADIVIIVYDDNMDEYDETVVVTMGPPVNAYMGSPYEHTALIIDNDDPPSAYFGASVQQFGEAVGSVNVGILLDNVSAKNITVPFTLSGTATQGEDYTITTSPVLIPAGSTRANITITVTNDTIDENNETVIMTMDTPINAHVGYPGVHTTTIIDDDSPDCSAITFGSPAVALDASNKKVTAYLRNAGAADYSIIQIYIDWSKGSGGWPKLTNITFGSLTIWGPGNVVRPATITSFSGSTILPADILNRALVFLFDNTNLARPITVRVTFNNGCTPITYTLP